MKITRRIKTPPPPTPPKKESNIENVLTWETMALLYTLWRMEFGMAKKASLCP